MRRRLYVVIGSVLMVVAALVVRNQVKVYYNRQARAQAAAEAEEKARTGQNISRALF